MSTERKPTISELLDIHIGLVDDKLGEFADVLRSISADIAKLTVRKLDETPLPEFDQYGNRIYR